jgi:hypothetical protein
LGHTQSKPELADLLGKREQRVVQPVSEPITSPHHPPHALLVLAGEDTKNPAQSERRDIAVRPAGEFVR